MSLVGVSAHAEVLSLERWLLPRPVADRIEGSGVACRDLGLSTGGRHVVDVATLRVNLVPRLAVRAGLGMARFMETMRALDPTETTLAMGAGASVQLTQAHGFTVGLDVDVTRAAYGTRTLTDGTVLLALRGR
jgi:hypothetical protein